MKTLLAALTAAACSLVAPDARAQVFVGAGGPTPIGIPSSYSSYYTPPVTVSPDSLYVPPYSYFAAFPLPARGYFGYGSADFFPYYGRPYSHPYDRWTWNYLSGDLGLSRYYYPPVR